MKHHLLLVISFMMLLSGCQQEALTHELPTASLQHYNVPFSKTANSWRSSPNTHDLQRVLPFSEHIVPTTVIAGATDTITFDQAMPLQQLSISFWQDGIETFLLFNVDDLQFQYPQKTGTYTLVLFFETAFGTAEYVTAITVVAEN